MLLTSPNLTLLKSTMSKRERSRSPEDQRKKRMTERLPGDAAPISEDDYFLKMNEFQHWLKEEKERYFDELSGSKARQYVSSFILTLLMSERRSFFLNTVIFGNLLNTGIRVISRIIIIREWLRLQPRLLTNGRLLEKRPQNQQRISLRRFQKINLFLLLPELLDQQCRRNRTGNLPKNERQSLLQ